MLRLHHLDDFGKVYVRTEFDPLEESVLSPAVYGTPMQVAAWLRQLADDIEGLEGETGHERSAGH